MDGGLGNVCRLKRWVPRMRKQGMSLPECGQNALNTGRRGNSFAQLRPDNFPSPQNFSIFSHRTGDQVGLKICRTRSTTTPQMKLKGGLKRWKSGRLRAGFDLGAWLQRVDNKFCVSPWRFPGSASSAHGRLIKLVERNQSLAKSP